MRGTRLTRNITRGGILAAISILLFQFELALPFMPPWLKLDISTLPVVIAGFGMGPWWGLAIQGVKSLLHLFQTSSGGVGELADFIMGGAFVLAAAGWYARHKTIQGAAVGLGLGTAALVAAGLFANAFILIPMYLGVMPMEAIIGAAGGKNAAITDLSTYLLYAVVPFNLLKGVLVSGLTFLTYKRIRPLLKDA